MFILVLRSDIMHITMSICNHVTQEYFYFHRVVSIEVGVLYPYKLYYKWSLRSWRSYFVSVSHILYCSVSCVLTSVCLLISALLDDKIKYVCRAEQINTNIKKNIMQTNGVFSMCSIWCPIAYTIHRHLSLALPHCLSKSLLCWLCFRYTIRSHCLIQLEKNIVIFSNICLVIY